MKSNEPILLVYSPGTRKGNLDDDYRLYDNGVITHDFDEHTYPGGYNLNRELNVNEIDESLKNRLYNAAKEENKELVYNLLQMKEVIKPKDYLDNKNTYDKLKENYINSVVLSRFYKRNGEYLIRDSFKSMASYLIGSEIISEEGLNFIIITANKEIEEKYPVDNRSDNDIKKYISQITPSLKKK